MAEKPNAAPRRPVAGPAGGSPVAPLPGYSQGLDLETVFRGPLELPSPSPIYVATMGLVALFMLLLPLVYFALMGGIIWLTYLHLAHDSGIVESGSHRESGRVLVFRLFLYLAPAVVALFVLFFLVKPLFAPRARMPKPEPIHRSEEPLLYDYVERLCKLMGAPVPREIVADCELNASAGIRHGIWSLFFSDLRLTIGMPLVAGMDLRQFTGLLAHEFGHFSQRTAFRFSYLVDTMNGWFARIAYQRDQWDLYLLAMSQSSEGGLRLVAGLAQLCIWVSRLVLRVLCFIGAAASRALLRAMEYDADACQAHVAGSAMLGPFHRRLHDLMEATKAAQDELAARPEAERVPDNLPVLYAAALNRIPVEQLDKSWVLHADEAVGLFHTHPSPNARIAAAEKLGAPGVVAVEAPARVLFKDFDGICRKVTYLYLREHVGEKVMSLTFAPVKEFLAAHQQTDRSLAALESIVGPEVLKTFSIRPMFLRLDELEAPAEPGALAEKWNKAREAMGKQRGVADEASRALRAADDAIDRAVQAESLRRAGAKYNPQTYGLTKRSMKEAEEVRAAALDKRGQAEYALEPFEKAYRQRMASALQLLAVKGIDGRIPGATALRGEAAKLLSASAALRESFGTLYELSRRVLAAQAIFSRTTNLGASAMEELDRLTSEISLALRRAHADLDAAGFPFEHGTAEITIAYALLPALPREEAGPNVLAASTMLRDGYFNLTRRVLARLAEITLQVEECIRSARQRA